MTTVYVLDSSGYTLLFNPLNLEIILIRWICSIGPSQPLKDVHLSRSGNNAKDVITLKPFKVSNSKWYLRQTQKLNYSLFSACIYIYI